MNLEIQRVSGYSKSSRTLSGVFNKPHKCSHPVSQPTILSLVESQIIPCLLKAKRFSVSRSSVISSSFSIISQREIKLFVDFCITQDLKASQAFVEHFLDSGLNAEDIYLELIAPAARYFGSLWDDDQINFTQANIGFVRLHVIANAIKFSQKEGLFFKGKTKRVMIASVPGSLHLLGATSVSEFFRMAEWQVVVKLSNSANELSQTVSNSWFDVIGLSISIDEQLTNLPDLISELKRVSVNPRIAVLLGGAIFMFKELCAKDFGAGDICNNAKHAVGIAESLLPEDLNQLISYQ